MTTETTPTTDAVTDEVRDRYARAARAVVELRPAEEACCGPTGEVAFGDQLYDAADRQSLPEAAVLASLGCGNPTAVAELRPGETVLDLGSGGGIDVLLSARRVGPTGKAYGVDMTDEMLTLARANAVKAGATNVEFVKGTIESVPLPDTSVDVVVSNCVINLSTDKPAVLAEVHSLLRPGGRVGVSDVVAEDYLDATQRAERGSYVGCIAGALSIGEYHDGLTAAGFTDISIIPTHQVADGMHSAIVTARKPATDSCCGVHGCCTAQEQPVDLDTTVAEVKATGGCGCASSTEG